MKIAAPRPAAAALLGATLLPITCAYAQVPVGKDVAERLSFPPLTFDAPEPERREVAGVAVLYLRDASLPLVSVFARFEGGFARFPRADYAAATALPSLLRYGGTADLPPDSVDELLEYYAVQTSFGGAGETTFSSVNTLTEYLEPALSIWGDMVARPRFDTAQIEVWRLRELESVRRREDDPQRLAFSEFNRLMFGDHPVGWELAPRDLEPQDVYSPRLERVHRRIVCRQNLVLGVTGDASWEVLEPHLRRIVSALEACSEPLPESPDPAIRKGGGIFLMPRALEQSVIVMAHPHGVRMDDSRDYFSAQIGNMILGSSGFSSRLVTRVRTEKGYAYSASSLWTMPRRHDGIVGALTRTRPENMFLPYA